MPVMQVNDVISPEASTPFLTFKSGSNTQTWEGLFAFNYQITKIDPEFAPTAVWPVENITLHTAGAGHNVSLSRDGRWSKGFSIPGRLCFYPRNQLIKSHWNQAGEFVAFGVSKEIIQLVAAEAHRGDPENIQFKAFGVFDDPFLAQLGWKLLSLLQDPRLSARLYAESLGVTLAHHLLHHYGSFATPTTVKVPPTLHHLQIQNAVEYIHAHYTRNLSLSEIAGAANLSVAHFTRLFRKATGRTPYEYLIRHRVEQAYLLFQQRRYSGAEIAQRVGFYDESHLLRSFKRIYGTSPTKLFH